MKTKKRNDFFLLLDNGIREAVKILADNDIETFESCEGGKGHPYSEPTIRFHGDNSEGLRGLAVAIQNNLNVASLKRTYDIIDKEITGPWWELTFIPPQT